MSYQNITQNYNRRILFLIACPRPKKVKPYLKFKCKTKYIFTGILMYTKEIGQQNIISVNQ